MLPATRHVVFIPYSMFIPCSVHEISAPKQLEQEDCSKFRASLGYMWNTSLALAIQKVQGQAELHSRHKNKQQDLAEFSFLGV